MTRGALASPRVGVAVVRVRAALLVGIVATTGLAMAVNMLGGGNVWAEPGVARAPAALVAWPDFSTIGRGLNVEVFTRLDVLAALLAIFSIMLSDFFDPMGTVVGIGAGFVAHVFIRLVRAKPREVHPLPYAAAAFVLFFAVH